MKLFVYGTLQPGEPLAGWLESAYHGEHLRATTPGLLFHVPGGSDDRPIYPVALVGPQQDARHKPTGEPKVYGTVLQLDDAHDAVLRTVRMEESAGYMAVSVLCELADGTFVEAAAFTYLHPTGPRIEHGDWLRVVHPDVELECVSGSEEVSPM